MTLRRTVSRGFTLVEILIVVVILGVIAALVVPNFASATTESAQAAFISQLRIFGDAAVLQWTRTGDFPEDASSGELPVGFEEYIDRRSWESGTPIGGVWDAELNEWEVTSAIGVHFDGTGKTRGDEYMLVVDATFDDGDLDTGAFRKLANERYYLIVEE